MNRGIRIQLQTNIWAMKSIIDDLPENDNQSKFIKSQLKQGIKDIEKLVRDSK